jgi:hypothetical protein
MYVPVAFLAVGLLCNLAVKPVSRELFATVDNAASKKSHRSRAFRTS